MRVNSGTVNVEVQWQMRTDTDDDDSGSIEADEWMDLAGETGLELTLTDDHAGHSVRAKLTHKGDEDNPSYVTWVDYTTPVADGCGPADGAEQHANPNSGDLRSSCQSHRG